MGDRRFRVAQTSFSDHPFSAETLLCVLHYSKIASWTGLLLHIYSKNASEALAIFSSVDSIFFLMNSLRILWTIMFEINKADSLLEVFETIN